jgi:probable HAF family extracellular repeat protein
MHAAAEVRLRLCVGVALFAGLATSAALAQQPGAAGYRAVEYARLVNPGTISVVRDINNRDEVSAAFKASDRRKMSQAFILTPSGPLDVAATVETDNAVAYGLNDSGEVVGAFNIGVALRPFKTVRQSSFRQLPLLPQDTGGAAYAINDSGEVVGYSSGSNGQRAVSWTRDGAVRALPGPAGTTSRASDINTRGDVVGVLGDTSPRGALWPGKESLVTLAPLFGFTGSEAAGINERGDVAGFSVGASGDPDRSRAVLWRAGASDPTDLGTLPGGDFSRAYGINARGEVVGTSTTADGDRAFIWTETRGMVDLNTLVSLSDLTLVNAVSINRNGVILAIAQEAHDEAGEDDHHHEGPRRIVVLRPVS